MVFVLFPRVFHILCWDFLETGAVDFQNPGFWRLKAPETRIWAPEGAIYGDPYIKGTKRQFVLNFCTMFSAFFQKYLAPSGAKYCGKGWPLLGKASGRVWKGFGKGLGIRKFWKCRF